MNNKSTDPALFVTEGDIDGSNAHRLLTGLMPLIEQHRHVVIDMRNTTSITSKGLAALLDAVKLAGDRRLEIRHASNDVAELLELTGFARLIDLGRQQR